MTLKKLATAGALALSAATVLASVSPASARTGGPGPGPGLGRGERGPNVASPTSVDGNGIANHLISLNICGVNLIPIELIPVLSPTTTYCHESQIDGLIKMVHD